MKVSNNRKLDQEARRLLLASGALGAVSGVSNMYFGHPIFAMFGFVAAIAAVVLYPAKKD